MTFKALLDLQPGWDTYGAPAISRVCVGRAKAFLRGLGLHSDYAIVPTSKGGVSLEWFEKDLQEMSVTFDPDDPQISFYRWRHDEEMESRVPMNDARTLVFDSLVWV